MDFGLSRSTRLLNTTYFVFRFNVLESLQFAIFFHSIFNIKSGANHQNNRVLKSVLTVYLERIIESYDIQLTHVVYLSYRSILHWTHHLSDAISTKVSFWVVCARFLSWKLCVNAFQGKISYWIFHLHSKSKALIRMKVLIRAKFQCWIFHKVYIKGKDAFLILCQKRKFVCFTNSTSTIRNHQTLKLTAWFSSYFVMMAMYLNTFAN